MGDDLDALIERLERACEAEDWGEVRGVVGGLGDVSRSARSKAADARAWGCSHEPACGRPEHCGAKSARAGRLVDGSPIGPRQSCFSCDDESSECIRGNCRMCCYCRRDLSLSDDPTHAPEVSNGDDGRGISERTLATASLLSIGRRVLVRATAHPGRIVSVDGARLLVTLEPLRPGDPLPYDASELVPLSESGFEVVAMTRGGDDVVQGAQLAPAVDRVGERLDIIEQEVRVLVSKVTSLQFSLRTGVRQ